MHLRGKAGAIFIINPQGKKQRVFGVKSLECKI